MKVKSSKDTKMKRLGAEELVELGKYRLSKGRSKASKKKKWCVLDRRLKATVKCYMTRASAKAARNRHENRTGFTGIYGRNRYEVVKGKK